MKMPIFQLSTPYKDYLPSDSFKTPSFYCMHHDKPNEDCSGHRDEKNH